MNKNLENVCIHFDFFMTIHIRVKRLRFFSCMETMRRMEMMETTI